MAIISSTILLLPVAGLLYGIVLVIYRLTIHPLARFPGPKIAAATRWYEFYHDILNGQGGQFALEIDKMHDIYGPIVRVNPDELHIKDSDYFPIFYSGIRHKYGWAASMVGAEEASFGTVDHDLHKARRSANAKFLSKRTILAREHVIADAMRKTNHIMQTATSVIDLYPLMLAFTTEAVWQFTINKSSGLLDEASSRLAWHETMQGSLLAIPILRQLSWVMALASQLPLSFLKIAAPPVAALLSLQQDTTNKAQAFLDDPKKGGSDHTIFHAIYESALPPAEKTAFRLSQEVFTVFAAAANTTTHHLVYGVYYLASNPKKLALFQEAVRSLKGDVPSWTDLSAHPYVKATMKEVLRLRAMSTGRSPYLATVPLQYGKWLIPPMTAVSLTVRDVLLDPRIFKDPESFVPERWLGDTSSIDQYFVPFGKGSRNCQGLELAWAEMYIAIGSLFRNFDVELIDMDFERDLRYTKECLISLPPDESKLVRIRVRPVTA